MFGKLERYLRLAATVALIIVPICLEAQNNRYKIDDGLYKIYVKADSKRFTEEGLRIAEQMYDKAGRMGDKKAQCMATTVAVHYYANKKDLDNLIKAVDRSKEVSQRNGYLQYYYFSWGKLIAYYINRNQPYKGLKEAQAMRDAAYASSTYSHYGIYSSIRILGDFYKVRSNNKKAAEYYREGLEYCLKHAPEQDPAVFYLNLSSCERTFDNHEESLRLIEEGLKRCKTKNNVSRLLVGKALALADLGRKTEFMECYRQAMSVMKTMDDESTNAYIHINLCYYLMLDSFSVAHEWAEKFKDPIARASQHAIIYGKEGDYKSAYLSKIEQVAMYREYINEQQSVDIAEFNAEFDNQRLREENLLLENENTQGKLKTARLLAAQNAAEANSAKVEAYNKELKLSNSELLIRQIQSEKDLAKAELDKHQIAQDRERARVSARQRMLLLALGAAFVLLLLSAVYRYRSQKLIHNLRIARDKAEESERLKTMFIQNVSHEIRTPLNAIVGFSNLLTNPDMPMSDGEKQEFSKIIGTNSDLLTTLVNDVLVLSELQSGKTSLTVAPCRVNELCRVALDTVTHRKPEGVELRFTTDVADDFSIDTDARRISQVLINFLTNAEKYTTEGSITLDCSAKKEDGHVTFSVTDTGCGIPKDKQERIFGRFEKLDDFHQGIGLGLNICAMIANIMHAKIGIDGEYTDGARFYFAVKY